MSYLFRYLFHYLFILLLICLASLIKAQENPQPDQIIEIFRHGYRAPKHNFDPTWLRSDYGSLTTAGMRQHFVLGRVLYNKYPYLFGSKYDNNKIYMLSDRESRCIQSALSHLYGIYLGAGPQIREDYPAEMANPPFDDPYVKEIADSLNNSTAVPYDYAPPVVDLVDESTGYLFQSYSQTYCPNNEIWKEASLYNERAQEAWRRFNTTINNLNTYINPARPIRNLNHLKYFIEVMLANIYDNRTLPRGITDPQLISNLTHAFYWIDYHQWCGEDFQKQLFSFGLMDAMLGELAGFREGKSTRTVVMYSGHDGNIFPILAALGVVTEECLTANFESSVRNEPMPFPNCRFPAPASNLLFEFYNNTESPYLKFYIDNILVPLCDGKDVCPYDEFVRFIRNATGNLTEKEYFKQCGYHQNSSSESGLADALLVEQNMAARNSTRLLIVIAVLAVVLFGIVGKMIYDERGYKRSIHSLREERLFPSDVPRS